MASWASVAGSRAKPVEQQPVHTPNKPEERIAVIDSNAIIGGLQLRSIADVLVTIPEVLTEIRDKSARQNLAALNIIGIQTREPSDESLKKVLQFARATGDMHSLSAVDTKLIALAHTLEVAAYGDHHLRTSPAQSRATPRKVPNAASLPGWGASGGEWSLLDAVNEAEAAGAQHDAEESRISVSQLELKEEATDGRANSAFAGDDQAADTASDSDSEGEDADGDAGWQHAGSSKMAERRRARKQRRWEARQAALHQSLISIPSSPRSEADAAASAAEPARTAAAGHGALPVPEAVGSRGAASGEAEAGGDEGSEEDYEEPGSVAAGSEHSADGCEQQEDSTRADVGDSSIELQSEQGTESCFDDASLAGPLFESSIGIVTADFAMQNVVLQMGLRLVSPDGRRINRLSRWVLRCSACFKITKEAGRLFCPHCGNATLEKVEAVIGPDGAEHYGVRKQHNIRGTRFSLPKPKGGKNSQEPVLREDMLRLPRKKPVAADKDPFAPEYGAETWFARGDANAPDYSKGAAAVLAAWKRNPNERKPTRSNRRK